MYTVLTHGHFFCRGTQSIKVDIEAPFIEKSRSDASMKTGRTHYQVEEDSDGLAQVIAYDKDEGRIGPCMVSAKGSENFCLFVNIEDKSYLPAKIVVDVNEITEV